MMVAFSFLSATQISELA